jgi:galactitol-specific phosphotransferase system IIB component
MKKILFICGSMNQTTMMHQIAQNLSDYDSYFTPYYSDGIVRAAAKTGILDFSVLGGKFKTQTLEYLYNNKLKIDSEGKDNDYDLVVTCSDLIIQKNIRNKKVVLVQEGMTDPENLAYYIVKTLKLPRYFASTSVTGLSDAYDVFCVASEGYRELFIKKGVKPEKIAVTGIPNYDNCAQYLKNNFPYRNYVLVCTSDMRETYKYENRKKFILEALKIANGRQLIFKLHPNEKFDRAKKEVDKWAPGSLVFQTENTNHMIANCDVLITRYSTVVYVGIALGKEVYSAFNLQELKRQCPIQNSGMSAVNIARICREMIESRRDISNLIPDIIKKFSPQVSFN